MLADSVVELPDDEALRVQHETLRRLGSLVARVERERTATGSIVAESARRAGELPFAGSATDFEEENGCADHPCVRSKETVDGYLAELFVQLRVVPEVVAHTVAALLLGSVDPQFRCKLRHVPSRAVSVRRSWAHVHSLRMGLGEVGTARAGRLVTLALLNRREARSPHEEAVEVLQGSVARQASNRTDKAVSVEVPPMLHQRKPVEAPPGRELSGFCETLAEATWHIEGQTVRMPKGQPLLLLVPTQAEREVVTTTREVIVWWYGKARRLSSTSVQAIRKSRFEELTRLVEGKSDE